MDKRIEKVDEEIYINLIEAGLTEDEIIYYLYGDPEAEEESLESMTIFEIHNKNNEIQQEIVALNKEMEAYTYDATFGREQKVQESIDDMGL